MHLIFATHNENKVVELRRIIPKSIVLWSLNDINYLNPIEETGKTLEENAKIKSDFIRRKFGLDCFADDSGLEIDFLEGEPGVLSARYAGPAKNNDKNIIVLDVFKKEINYEPFIDILKNKKITKVLHAGRQDCEIFLNFLPKTI